MTDHEYKPENFNGCEFKAWLANLRLSGLEESPIEALMNGALTILVEEFTTERLLRQVPFESCFLVSNQHKFGKYRADIAICLGGTPRGVSGPGVVEPLLIVECDGHDFHEKTKEQAAHDKKRDRWFTAQGIKVLRYSGSEIFRDPMRCAFETVQVLKGIFQGIEASKVSDLLIERAA